MRVSKTNLSVNPTGHHCPDAEWRYITQLDGEYVNCLCRERLENARQLNLLEEED